MTSVFGALLLLLLLLLLFLALVVLVAVMTNHFLWFLVDQSRRRGGRE